ncbi:hypothetical protein QKU48_gp0498 [Fadolivirus algeromassiliense]|jgi:hypothetical protein|uniref:Uncharacterized protein n=1 Tax=Fadolivirus FV1/VV64 TaxID=3070911 RepID=A0A7D3V7J9_9VIRU|nr:hypothetical protein QKU48_gp0498 [Fadolivirus algeromassiliense]QKF93956.1 hypothetical protein Fadolivirus_1_498 [Fadolivirus FV1/VV64]
MDLVSGLAVVGSYMNNREVPTHDKINTLRIKRNPINGNNIYNNAKYWEYKKYVDNLANERYKLARDPMKTGVIPNFYNQLQVVEKRKEVARQEYLRQKKARKEYLSKIKEKKIEGFNVGNEENKLFTEEKTKSFFHNINKVKTEIIVLIIVLILLF